MPTFFSDLQKPKQMATIFKLNGSRYINLDHVVCTKEEKNENGKIIFCVCTSISDLKDTLFWLKIYDEGEIRRLKLVLDEMHAQTAKYLLNE